MKKESQKEPLELIRGSGNIYWDFNLADADIRQLKATNARTEILLGRLLFIR